MVFKTASTHVECYIVLGAAVSRISSLFRHEFHGMLCTGVCIYVSRVKYRAPLCILEEWWAKVETYFLTRVGLVCILVKLRETRMFLLYGLLEYINTYERARGSYETRCFSTAFRFLYNNKTKLSYRYGIFKIIRPPAEINSRNLYILHVIPNSCKKKKKN